MAKKSVRITVSPSEARAYKDKQYWDEVLRKLIAERDKLTAKIARLKKKVPVATLQEFESKRKAAERQKLSEATAVISKALSEGKL